MEIDGVGKPPVNGSLFFLDLRSAKTILTIATPVILGMIIQASLNVADTIMIGQLPPALSGPGTAMLVYAMPLLWLVGGFLSAISVGTQALTARRFGEKNDRGAGQILTNSLFVAAITGIVFSILGSTLIQFVFPFFHSDPLTVQLGIEFCQIKFFSIFAWVLTFSIKSFFDGLGKTYLYMIAAIIMSVANVFLNWVLIFGKLGFPEMGVNGAAWGSTIGTTFGFLLMFMWILTKKFRTHYGYFCLKNLNLHVMKEIARISLPSGVATMVIMTGFLLFGKIVGLLDAELGSANYASASQLIITAFYVNFIGSMGFGIAVATLVSQNLGAKRPARAEKYIHESIKIAVLIFGSLGLFFAIFPEIPLRLMINRADVILLAKPTLRFVSLMSFMIPVGLIYAHSLAGAGNTKYVMMVEVILHFCCLIPLSYLFSMIFDMKLFGAWLAVTCYFVGLSVLMGLKVRQGKWKEITI